MNEQTVPSVMRALVLDGIGFDHLAVRTVPVPRPGPGQMLARVDAAGVCTSLLKLIDQGAAHSLVNGWDIERFPLILGDEGAVTLVQVGARHTDRFQPGQRCVVQPAVDHPPINHRERYRSEGAGMEKVAVGYTLPGHLAEYILLTEEAIEAECVIPTPYDNLPYAHAAIAEPISCCLSSQDHHVHLAKDGPGEKRRAEKGLKPGGVTVVLGAGAMGRMHVDLAIGAGPRAIVVANRGTERLRLTEQLFANRALQAGVELRTVSPRKEDLAAVVYSMTAGRGADDVIVAVGSREAIESAQALCGRGAVLNLFGGMKKGDDIIGLDTGIVHYKEINVTGSSGGSPWDILRTLELMGDGAVDTAAHITRIGDLSHAAVFLRQIREGKLNGKAVVYPHRSAENITTAERWTADDEAAYLRG